MSEKIGCNSFRPTNYLTNVWNLDACQGEKYSTYSLISDRIISIRHFRDKEMKEAVLRESFMINKPSSFSKLHLHLALKAYVGLSIHFYCTSTLSQVKCWTLWIEKKKKKKGHSASSPEAHNLTVHDMFFPNCLWALDWKV